MQTQPRGRNVQRKPTSQTTQLIYWSLGGIALVIGAFLVAFGAGGGFKTSTATTDVSTTTSPVNGIPTGITADGFYYKGNPQAAVKVIEYADFQCPACKNYTDTAGRELTTKFIETGKVQIIFHDFPLSQHPNAPKAAETARCAGDQDKFWQMHDMLYLKQNEWAGLPSPLSRFNAYASQIGLDTNTFERCLAGGKQAAKIAAAGAAANTAQINETPTFVIDGQRYNQFQIIAALDAILKTK